MGDPWGIGGFRGGKPNIKQIVKKNKNSDSPRVPHCRFILKIVKKSGKNRISDADPQKRISDS